MTHPAGPRVWTRYQVSPLALRGPSRMGTTRPSARTIRTGRSVPGALRTRSPEPSVPVTLAVPPTRKGPAGQDACGPR